MKLSSLLLNTIVTSRTEWLRKWINPQRNIESECGHPTSITVEDCFKAFRRGDIAGRVVEVYPDECWSDDPQVYETEDAKETAFEQAWDELTQRISLYPVLHRADILSGIGRFGVVLLGIDDGKNLNEPVDGLNAKGEVVGGPKEHKLLYLRPLDESVVAVKEVERDETNPRFGLPTVYEIKFIDPAQAVVDRSIDSLAATQAKLIHWHRVVHLADNRVNSDVYGMPRLERVYNRLLDLKKVSGGSGEMFWKGGFPGISLETLDTPTSSEPIDIDEDKTKEELNKYMEGMQRYLMLQGMQAKSLSVEVADPTPHATLQLKLIAAAMAVPWRIFVGSESAELASSQDMRSFNKRLNKRRESYLSPYVIRPFVDRLILLGVLPLPTQGYIIDWSDLNAPSDKEQAEVAKTQTDALSKYVVSGVDLLVPPFLYLTLVLRMSDEEAQAVIDASEERQQELGKTLGDEDGEEDNANNGEQDEEEEEQAPRNSNGR